MSMRLFRLGLGCVNSTVGAVDSNVERAVALAKKLAKDGVQLAAFPEQMIGGYPPEDLILWPGFVAAQARALAIFAQKTTALPTAFVIGLVATVEDQVYNCAAFVHGGRVYGLVPKEKLPLYNIFYESRTLGRGSPGLHRTVDLGSAGQVPFGDLLFCCNGTTIAIEICEDIWSPDGPLGRRCYQGAEVIVNVSASPFRIGMHESRRELISTRASDHQAVILYCNAIGANDGLIFDGGGFVNQNGRQLLDAPRFVEGCWAVTLDLGRTHRMRVENSTWRQDQTAFFEGQPRLARPIEVPGSTGGTSPLRYPFPPSRNFFLPSADSPPSPRTVFCEELLDAMALGVGDYFEKGGAFQKLGVALSGGRDSLLCLLIAHRYVTRRAQRDGADPRTRAAEVLRAFYMPTRYSSTATHDAAAATAQELGVPLIVLSIDEAFASESQATAAMLQPGEAVTPLTSQNIQSRLRGERMWNWSNATAGMWLQTGNMSEKAVGYTTIGGDLMGCLAPIANLPKTVVNYLLDYIFEKNGLESIRKTIAIPASAELAPNQEDERDLMPYPVLDACITLHLTEKLDPDEMATVLIEMFSEYPAPIVTGWTMKFVRLFSQSIYKWVQSPLSLHLGHLDLERERALQLPVITRREWQKTPPK